MKEQLPPTEDFWDPLPWMVKEPPKNPSEGSDSSRSPDPRKVTERSQSSREPAKTTEKAPAAKLTGRLTYTPVFDIRGERARVNMGLAQHSDTGETEFFRLYSTGRYIPRLKEKGMRKGDLVELTGVWQTHVSRQRGKVVEEKVFYVYGAKVR